MTRRRLLGGLAAFCLVSVGALADDFVTVADASRDAYSLPFPGLSDQERDHFFRGRQLFRQSWVVSPAQDTLVDGLGPLYNRLACVSCHPKEGRGRSPDGPGERMQSMLVRLSVPGRDVHGGPKPHPAYGGQLNEEGIPGVPGEGRAVLHWEEDVVTLSDGERIALRRPRIEFRELAYGALDGALTSPRVGPPVYGLGLLAAVPDAVLVARAGEAKPDGVKGKANRVWSDTARATVIGRFGLKANMPDVEQQIAGAMLGDLGITSDLHPDENCTAVQTACRAAPSGGRPELTRAQLADLTTYLSLLAVPARRGADDPAVRRGESLFAEAGCVHCHLPQMKTAARAPFPQLADQIIAPYTDLLVHDMGKGLADGRPDYRANGREWRTPPLWGIGLLEKVNEHSQLLHDGRARNFTEAILWHGGEAKTARDRFAAWSREKRDALLAFLGSL